MTNSGAFDFYDAYYYSHGCGDRPYQRDEAWLAFFDNMAARIIRDIHPATVLDVGCAMGLLVEGFRRQGVQAFGMDISLYALGQLHSEVKPYCWQGSITDPLPHKYDLVTCIEILEHLPPAEVEKAIGNLCAASDDILFSSTPFDYKEATHDNVQPPSYWAYQFARFGFYRDVDYDASYITPWAVRFRKVKQPVERIVAGYERKYWLLLQENQARRSLNIEQRNDLSAKELKIQELQNRLDGEVQFWKSKAKQYETQYQLVINSRSWRLITRFQRLRERIIPPGSGRENAIAKVFRGWRILRQQGMAALVRRIGQEISWSVHVFVQKLRFRVTRPKEAEVIELESVQKVEEVRPHQASVDIVVCVHNALPDVTRCLESVVRNTNQPYRLILVDDGSDEPTKVYLQQFAQKNSALLMRNEQAQGYTYAANQGMRASDADFVVLLNSDTIVTPQWIDRMVMCAESREKIGIVGPLSNTASWQSIPEYVKDGDWADNPLPPDVSVEQMAELVIQYSPRVYPPMPFLNGFCLMIRRELLNEIGYFDEENFGKGYGEENDFCLRARASGWELALADDVYIYHAQSKSYSNERRKELSHRAGVILAKKHGQEIIDQGVDYCRNNRVLEGLRAHSKHLLDRRTYLQRGRLMYSGKKVLFVLPIKVPGGGGNIVLMEAKAMQKMGVDVHIFNLKGHWSSFEKSYPNLDLPVIYGEIDELPKVAARFDAVVATLYITPYWLKPAKDINPDLVYGYYVQDFEPFFFEPGTEGYQQAWDSYTLIPGMKRFSKTQWTANQIVQHTGAPCDVVGVSVDVDLFIPRPRPLEWPERPLRIGAMVRPNSPRRGPRMTMEVLRDITRRYGGQVEAWLFGTTPDDPGFGQLPQDFPWKLAGILSPGQVAQFLNQVDIFVDFSTYQAMGLTALEAMSSGAAVIITNHGGTSSFAQDENNTLVIDATKAEECRESLIRLLDDHELRRKLQINGIRSAQEYYPERPAFNILGTLFGGAIE